MAHLLREKGQSFVLEKALGRVHGLPFKPIEDSMTRPLLRKLAPLAPLALMGFLALPSVAEAASPIRTQGNLGLGLGSGVYHSGLSVKYFAGATHSLQGVIGTHGFSGGLGVSADYLYEMPTIIGDTTGIELGWAIGAGPSIGIDDNYLELGGHGTIGLEINIQAVPIDIVFEYKPGFVIRDGDLDADLYNFAGHIRFYPFGWKP